MTAARLGIDIQAWMVAPSHEPIVGGVLFGRCVDDIEVESPILYAPIVHWLVHARRRDLAVDHGHRVGGNTEFGCRCRQHETARPGCGLAQCGAAGLKRHRSCREAFIRRDAGFRRNHAHAFDINIEFFRYDQTQRRQDSLPKFDFPGHGDNPAGFNGNPTVERRHGLERPRKIRMSTTGRVQAQQLRSVFRAGP